MFRRKRHEPEAAPSGAVLGVLASRDHVVVRPDGRVDQGDAPVGFEWIIGASDGWHRAGARAGQRLVDGLPVVETTLRVPGGHVVQRVWCVTDAGAELAVLEVENHSKEAVSVALAIDGPHLRFDGGRSLAGGAVIALGRRPARVVIGGGQDFDAAIDVAPFRDATAATLLWPLAHTASLRVAVVLDGDWADSPGSLPDAEAVVRGWRTHIDAGARLSSPDPVVNAAVVTARAALLVRGARWWRPAEAAGVGAALEAWGHHEAARAPIEVLLDGQRVDGSFDRGRPEATADALAAWAAHVRAGADAEAAERLAEPVAKAAHRLAKLRGESAPPAWTTVGQYDAASVLDRAGQPEAAALCRDRARATTTPPPRPTALAEVQAVAPGVGGVDLGVDVALLLAVHRLLVDDTQPGVLTVVPVWPDEWLGADLEIHRLPTRAGLLSLAVRWHGARPALLWEVDAAVGVELRAGLDPSWRSADPAGEALLGPVEPAGGLPGVVAPLTGDPTPVDEAPDDGVSFR